MTWPQHRNPQQHNRRARAPYNFVPLPEQVVTVNPATLPDQGRYHPEHHTGSIECLLTTESPLYVRCPFTREEFDRQEKGEDADRPFREQVRNKPDFFYTTPQSKEPVIPGSSLRGMLRTLVEIVGYGKLTAVTDRRLFFRTVDASRIGRDYRRRMVGKVRGGILRIQGGDYFIQPCLVGRATQEQLRRLFGQPTHIGSPPNQIPNPDLQYREVWVALRSEAADDPCRFLDVQTLKDSSHPGLRKGRVVITGNVPRKRREFVFVLEDDGTAIEVDREGVIERFHDEDQLTQWQQDAFPAGKGRLQDGQPVFYTLNDSGGVGFLGRAQMFRLPYEKSPCEHVPEVLRRPTDVDLADAIFGYTGLKVEPGPKSYAGRVFITDAHLEPNQGDVWLSREQPIIVSQILSGPKPTTFQHYLVQQHPDNARNLSHYASPTPDQTVIRGHKLYWHKGNVTRSDFEDLTAPVNSTQHTQFKPVKAGVKFRFRIHFENLSKVELGAVLWVLTLPGEPNKTYRHNLGMGKPLGLGAVRIEPTLHLTNRTQRYRRLLGQDTWELGAEDQPGLALKAILAFERYVLTALSQRQRLMQLDRIRMLLKLLEWFDPDPDNIKKTYMALPEFRGRPVLPDPLSI